MARKACLHDGYTDDDCNKTRWYVAWPHNEYLKKGFGKKRIKTWIAWDKPGGCELDLVRLYKGHAKCICGYFLDTRWTDFRCKEMFPNS